MKPKSPASVLRLAGVPSLLVTNPLNIGYLTNIILSEGMLLITPKGFHLFVDGRYGEAAEGNSSSSLRVHDRRYLETALNKRQVIGIESGNMTVDLFFRMRRKYKNTKFVQCKGVIEHFRRQKGEDEIRKFFKAKRITLEILRRVPQALKSRPTEKQLADKLFFWAKELGADGLAFDPVVAFGTHTSMPHHHASGRRLEKGHLVQIDVGARYKGYCADLSQVFFTSPPLSLQAKVLEAVERAKDKVIECVKHGADTHDLDRIARKVLSEYGFEKYFVHSLGHGIGLDVHEGISISQKKKSEKLLKNEIITIEPGVYLPGKFGIRLEEMVLVG